MPDIYWARLYLGPNVFEDLTFARYLLRKGHVAFQNIDTRVDKIRAK
jgi:hypothetical protein